MREPSPASLLPLPPQVEERIVDPDRHADHQDDRAQCLGVGRNDVTDETVHAGGGQYGGEGQDHGQARRNERAEREDQDRDRQRQRDQLDPAQITLEPLADLVVRGGLSELLHGHARMGGLGRGDRGHDRRNLVLRLVGGSSHVELHEHRATIARDQPGFRMLDRGDDSCDIRLLRERQHDAGHRRRELRLLIDRSGRRLHQHALPRRDLEVSLVEDLLGPPRLSVRDRPALHLARTNRAAHQDRHDSERDPAERRRFPMRSTPPSRPAREVRAAHHQHLPIQARPQHSPVRSAAHRGELPMSAGKPPICPESNLRPATCQERTR